MKVYNGKKFIAEVETAYEALEGLAFRHIPQWT